MEVNLHRWDLHIILYKKLLKPWFYLIFLLIQRLWGYLIIFFFFALQKSLGQVISLLTTIHKRVRKFIQILTHKMSTKLKKNPTNQQEMSLIISSSCILFMTLHYLLHRFEISQKAAHRKRKNYNNKFISTPMSKMFYNTKRKYFSFYTSIEKE